MIRALESFREYVILTESYKGPDQVNLSSINYTKPEVFSKTFTTSSVSVYDEPKFIEKEVPGLKPEEFTELMNLGILNAAEIEHIDVKSLNLTYDIIMMWTYTGADDIIFIPKSAKIEFEVSIWDENSSTSETKLITVTDDNIGDRFEWDSWRGPGRPFEPTAIEISMNDSFEPNGFYYDFTIGAKD